MDQCGNLGSRHLCHAVQCNWNNLYVRMRTNTALRGLYLRITENSLYFKYFLSKEKIMQYLGREFLFWNRKKNVDQTFQKNIFFEEYWTRTPTFYKVWFWKFWFLKYFLKCAQFLSALFIILVDLTVTSFSGKNLISTRCTP